MKMLVFRFLVFIFGIGFLAFFTYLFIQWLMNPEFRLFKEKVQHNIDKREINVDKEVQAMRDDIAKLQKELKSRKKKK
jgi:hypothetical protein